MKIIFVTGGARSGKSAFALKSANAVSGLKLYIATAEELDAEMKDRVQRHRKERGHDWDTREEPLNIVGILPEVMDQYGAVLLDCLTLWLSNVMLQEDKGSPVDYYIDKLVAQLKSLRDSGTGTLLIVSNEVGMGIVPENKLARRFRDYAGTLNQRIAELANEVYMVISGIPVKIK
ncbi:MAG: bifunctional adenosylcobinamide kinase/adenosylcobinamide-phosphate guanylyltransferase [Nitrospira sp.]|nr:bifunctional adenosylcobinamide kinase/adenosylcobinamide-phosphate guanylyltransferase [bacterium]MBL7048685.1 bifunctional adenosylcobinamide kinase/adenosylcobinamide-phosphate guanylyltransferase [Nitrospira sp.]